MKDQIFDVENTIIQDSSRELSFWEKTKENQIFRKTLIVLGLAILWEICARYVNNPLMLPTFIDTAKALFESLTTTHSENGLWSYIKATIVALFGGFLLGVVVAVIATVISVNSKIGEDIQHTITSLCTPLPAVAIAPVALLIFGLTAKMVLFVVCWATFWPVALCIFMGFKTSSQTILNVGRNIGLTGVSFTTKIRIPDTLPSILTGLRTGLSNGFRALVALEMVIAAATGSGGLGYFIMNAKNQLDTPLVFAGIVVTMIIGLFFETIFGWIEKLTVKKYGMMSN